MKATVLNSALNATQKSRLKVALKWELSGTAKPAG
jgi:hypothetical protein